MRRPRSGYVFHRFRRRADPGSAHHRTVFSSGFLSTRVHRRTRSLPSTRARHLPGRVSCRSLASDEDSATRGEVSRLNSAAVGSIRSPVPVSSPRARGAHVEPSPTSIGPRMSAMRDASDARECRTSASIPRPHSRAAASYTGEAGDAAGARELLAGFVARGKEPRRQGIATPQDRLGVPVPGAQYCAPCRPWPRCCSWRVVAAAILARAVMPSFQKMQKMQVRRVVTVGLAMNIRAAISGRKDRRRRRQRPYARSGSGCPHPAFGAVALAGG